LFRVAMLYSSIMIIIIMILVSVGTAQADLRYSDIPGYYLNKPSAATLEKALLPVLTFDSSNVLVSRSYLYACEVKAIRVVSSLSVNDAAAICMYTSNSALHSMVNKALLFLNESAVLTLAPYLKMFHNAVLQLQPSTISVCQGVDHGLYLSKAGTLINTVTTLLSWSYSQLSRTCEFFAGQGANNNCTIIWINSRSARSIKDYSMMSEENEYNILPGTLAKILSITEQQDKICRVVRMEELDPKDPAYPPNYSPNVVNIGKSLTAVEAGKIDVFLRVYAGKSSQVSITKSQIPSIIISGGWGSPTAWPLIDKVLNVQGGAPAQLQNSIIIAINEKSTRGLSLPEVKSLLCEAEAKYNGMIQLHTVR
jgi:hypothetical protein